MFWDVVIIIFSIVIVVGVAVKIIVDKRKGKSGCSCCPMQGECASKNCPSQKK